MDNKKIRNQKNKKGFTLIELLAVILILGIISLIAIPTVSNVIEQSRKGAFKNTIKNVADVVERSCVMKEYGENSHMDTLYIINGEPNYDIDVKGKLPDNAVIDIDTSCNIQMMSQSDNYCVYKTLDNDEYTYGDVVNGRCKLDNGEKLIMNFTPTIESCFVINDEGTIIGTRFWEEKCSVEYLNIPYSIDGKVIKKIGANSIKNYGSNSLVLYIIPSDLSLMSSEEEMMKYIKIDTLYNFFANQNVELEDFVTKTYEEANNMFNVMVMGITPNLKNDLSQYNKTCYKDDVETTKKGDYISQKNEYSYCTFDASVIMTLDNIDMTSGIKSLNLSSALDLEVIDEDAFYGNMISNLIFGNIGLKKIGSYAFAYNNLGNVDMSGLKNLEEISDSAFEESNIAKLKLPENLQKIGNYAFYTNNINNLSLPSSLTEIGSYAFYKNQISNLVLPDSVTTVGPYAFRYNNIANLVISNNIEIIKEKSFADSNVKKLTIGNKVREIELEGFGNNQFEEVVIPPSVKKIGVGAFGSGRLQKIDLGSVEYIDHWAFIDNPLTSVIIPDSVTHIGAGIFKENDLREVTIGSGLTSIPTQTFASNPNLQEIFIPNNIKKLEQNWCSSSIKKMIIDNNPDGIDLSGVAGCANIPKVFLRD